MFCMSERKKYHPIYQILHHQILVLVLKILCRSGSSTKNKQNKYLKYIFESCLINYVNRISFVGLKSWKSNFLQFKDKTKSYPEMSADIYRRFLDRFNY